MPEHHSPSFMLSHLSSRNTMVIAGPGFSTCPALEYLIYPGPKPSASLPLNQLSMDMLRCRGHFVGVVLDVHLPGQHHLAAIVHAGDGVGPALGLGQGRQEQASEDGDDGDDHQQFDQSKADCLSTAVATVPVAFNCLSQLGK